MCFPYPTQEYKHCYSLFARDAVSRDQVRPPVDTALRGPAAQ